MIEYAKALLPKVIFSRDLFRKELQKCIGWVEKDEVGVLYNWCLENFGGIYPDILSEAFENVAACYIPYQNKKI